MKKISWLLLCLLTLKVSETIAQKIKKPQSEEQQVLATQNDIKLFFNSYAEDLNLKRREAIANRYDSRGYFRVGNGNKTFVSFEESKNRYLTAWGGPKSFQWKDLSIEVLSHDAVNVIGLFDWQTLDGQMITYSYSALLIKKSEGWRIRLEDESSSPSGYTTKPVSGNSETAGLYKFLLTAQPGSGIAAHRHSADMNIKVAKGRKFLLMGNLDTAKVQIFETGSSFIIPANVWHLEWWEEETLEEITIMAPWNTERASPCTPRSSVQKQITYIPVKKELANKYIGVYQHPLRAERVYKVFFENDKLMLSRSWNSYKSIIVPISDTEFVSMDGLYTSLIFSKIEHGKAMLLTTTAQCVTFTATRKQ